MKVGLKRACYALGIAAMAALAACTTVAPPRLVAQPSDYAPREYKVFAGDELDVKVFGEDQLSRTVKVGEDGNIDLPLIGALPSVGKTVTALREEITAKYGSGYLLNPKVTLELKAYRPFTVLGEVNRSGNYPYLAGLTVKGAVAAAEGYTYRANKTEAWIKRREESEYKVYDLSRDLQVMPGDVIEIPERAVF